MKLVSVIVPVYNAEPYIVQTVRSVLAQTYPHFELIIVDDGSPDRSVELCQAFDDPRIKIVRQKDRGLAGARNTGTPRGPSNRVADRGDSRGAHPLPCQREGAFGRCFPTVRVLGGGDR